MKNDEHIKRIMMIKETVDLSLDLSQKAYENHENNKSKNQFFLDKVIITVTTSVLLGGTLYRSNIINILGISETLITLLIMLFGIVLILAVLSFHIVISLARKFMKIEYDWWGEKTKEFEELDIDSKKKVNDFRDSIINRKPFEDLPKHWASKLVFVLDFITFYSFFFLLVFFVLVLFSFVLDIPL